MHHQCISVWWSVSGGDFCADTNSMTACWQCKLDSRRSCWYCKCTQLGPTLRPTLTSFSLSSLSLVTGNLSHVGNFSSLQLSSFLVGYLIICHRCHLLKIYPYFGSHIFTTPLHESNYLPILLTCHLLVLALINYIKWPWYPYVSYSQR